MSIFDYTSWDKFVEKIKKDENTFLIALVFFMFLSGGLSIFFIVHYSHNEDIELVRNGIDTEAIVIKKDVSQYIEGDRGTNEIYYVELTFEDVHHAKHVAKEIVSENFYNNVKKGDVLKIRYSQLHPNVVSIQAKHI